MMSGRTRSGLRLALFPGLTIDFNGSSRSGAVIVGPVRSGMNIIGAGRGRGKKCSAVRVRSGSGKTQTGAHGIGV